jgi:general secretion pathway protein B
MSYILESLKKSDQQRQRGSVPGLLSDHGPGGPDPRQPPRWRSWPALAAGGLLLVNVIALAIWFQPWQSAETGTAVSAPSGDAMAGQGIANGAGAAQMTRGATKQEVAAAESPPPIAAVTDVMPSLRGLNTDGAGGAGENGKPADELPDGGDQPKDVAATAMKAVPAEPAEPAAIIAEEENSEMVPPGLAAVPRRTGEPPVVLAKPKAPLEMGQLPASFREGLPEIRISVHSFTKDPASRLVRVNGSILREGQAVSGLLVEEIRPDGILFIYKGQEFLYKDKRFLVNLQ